MINKALRGEELTIYGTGEFIRDYIYIDDVVLAFLFASVHRSLVAKENDAVEIPCGVYLPSGFAPKCPIKIILLTLFIHFLWYT